MKSRKLSLEQFAFLNKNLVGDNAEFLELISSHVGHLVFEFNLLEERLTSFIWMLISESSDSKGVLITHNMSYASKVDLFNRYSKYIQTILNKSISIHEKMIFDLRESGRLRNLVVHAEWNTVDSEGFAFTKFKFHQNDILQEFVQLNEDSLITIRNLIIETHNLFDEYEEMYGKMISL